MCGIVGTAGESSKKNDDIFNTLLILDQLRGIDSTGVAVVTREDYDVRIAKNVGNAYDLMETKQYTRAMGVQSRVIIGHNRSATSGTITRRNAHPFENDSLVGVHNGTLTSKWMLADAKDFTVDSENLYHHIDKHGLKDCLNNLAGAWSLVWWDKLNETLNFLRNKERPMFLTWTKDAKSMYWASEKWMLQVALSRNNVEHLDIIETAVDMHYCFDISKEGVIGKPHVSAANSTYRGYQGNFQHQTWHGVQQTQQTTTQTPAIGHTKETTTHKPVTNYEGKRGIVLEVLAQASDPFGGKYYVCLDPFEPARNIRLYINSKDVEGELLSKEITCDISPAIFIEQGKVYHKVAHSSVTVNQTVQGTEFFTDHKGNKLNEEQWFNRYGCCAACTGFVNPRQAFRFTQNGETICHECAADEDVLNMVSLA